jgi:hypothetical protein
MCSSISEDRRRAGGHTQCQGLAMGQASCQSEHEAGEECVTSPDCAPRLHRQGRKLDDATSGAKGPPRRARD